MNSSVRVQARLAAAWGAYSGRSFSRTSVRIMREKSQKPSTWEMSPLLRAQLVEGQLRLASNRLMPMEASRLSAVEL